MPRIKKDPGAKKKHNNLFCNWCSRQFRVRNILVRHLRLGKCNNTDPWTSPYKCEVCNIMYGNKMLLDTHKQKVHGITKKPGNTSVSMNPPSPLKPSEKKICDGCKKSWTNVTKLWLHIRKEHFNLKARVPYCEQKKVNQVWFEKVLNCNNLMEIHKTAPNTLVMRKLDENTAIKVTENNTELIDLTHLYPTDRMRNSRV